MKSKLTLKVLPYLVSAIIPLSTTNALASNIENKGLNNEDSIMIIGEDIVTKKQVNNLFSKFYFDKLNQKIEVVDSVKITNQIVAFIYYDQTGKINATYSNGKTFFDEVKTDSLITKRNLSKILLEYSKKIPPVIKKDNSYKENQAQKESFLNVIKKSNQPKTEPISSVVKESVKIPKNTDEAKKVLSAIPDSSKQRDNFQLIKEIKKEEDKTKSYDPKVAFNDFALANLNQTKPYVYGMNIDENKPTLISFVSKTCYYCKKLMKNYKNNPKAFEKFNVIFLPLGKANTEEWNQFFGVDNFHLTQEDLDINYEFFTKAHIVAKKNAGTPSNIWLSKKEEGKYILIPGLIPVDKLDLVFDDMVKPKIN